MIKDNDLLEKLDLLGFSFFAPERAVDPNAVLADITKSHDARLWEIFPAVLADTAERGLFDHVQVKRLLGMNEDRVYFDLLVAMSLALYKHLRLRYSWTNALSKALGAKAEKERDSFLRAVKKGEDLKVGGRSISPERLRTIFNMYLKKSGSAVAGILAAKEEFGVEYSLSQIFSPKQKDIFFKKLRGDKLTKTEKEYYSRVVKKKVMALANAELHRMALKLLG
jgi:hypothetical protein